MFSVFLSLGMIGTVHCYRSVVGLLRLLTVPDLSSAAWRLGEGSDSEILTQSPASSWCKGLVNPAPRQAVPFFLVCSEFVVWFIHCAGTHFV